MTYGLSYDWFKYVAQLTHGSQLMDFTLWLAMSHRGHGTRGDESPGLGLREERLYKAGLDPE